MTDEFANGGVIHPGAARVELGPDECLVSAEDAKAGRWRCCRADHAGRACQSNPWRCWHSGTGYHSFDSQYPPDGEQCRFEGCERTWGELNTTLPTPGGDHG